MTKYAVCPHGSGWVVKTRGRWWPFWSTEKILPLYALCPIPQVHKTKEDAVKEARRLAGEEHDRLLNIQRPCEVVAEVGP